MALQAPWLWILASRLWNNTILLFKSFPSRFVTAVLENYTGANSDIIESSQVQTRQFKSVVSL